MSLHRCDVCGAVVDTAEIPVHLQGHAAEPGFAGINWVPVDDADGDPDGYDE